MLSTLQLSTEVDCVDRGEELLELIQKRTAKDLATVEKFQMGGMAVREFCTHLTKEECRRYAILVLLDYSP